MAQYPKYNLALRLAGTIFQLLLVLVPLAILMLGLLQFVFAIALAAMPRRCWAGLEPWQAWDWCCCWWAGSGLRSRSIGIGDSPRELA
ncbi:MAG: hypothetical protein HC824_15155 [Synechococcales cyanobacterium RM1_1_8]|nr:hypothetical protein [Synechococcales cyanobacterium RM1_1_8]